MKHRHLTYLAAIMAYSYVHYFDDEGKERYSFNAYYVYNGKTVFCP